eukprot:CAMPEP_0178432408 /NCGR_PEP_ID=MMETSP0689_2-20121128/32364_1 /TAXON_ID=160604 /ORGANISM="Amphidinium massartii, Strain CS-259" /LENGTH=357 /DNA_ID=CAMNT_0020054383 /DNA_START=23 /DNA_END=1094 /DNA_ORIENTATION=+
MTGMNRSKMEAGRLLLSGALNGGGGGGKARGGGGTARWWSVNQAFEIPPESRELVEESGVPPLLMDSVDLAVQFLNNGRAPCPGGLCYMQEQSNMAFYVLFRSDKEQEAKNLAHRIERQRKGGEWQEAWKAGHPSPTPEKLKKPPQRPPPPAMGAPKPAQPPASSSPATGSRAPSKDGDAKQEEIVVERWTLVIDRWGSVEYSTFPADQEAAALRKYVENKTLSRVLFNPDGTEVDHGGLNPLVMKKLRGAYADRRKEQLTIKCAGCGNPYKGDERYCGHCGRQRPLASICTCGKAFAPGEKFCSACGKERPVATQWVPLQDATLSKELRQKPQDVNVESTSRQIRAGVASVADQGQ